MWLRGFLLLLLSCALPGFAQDRTFGVRSPEGDPVPFIYAVCERTGRYAMSDNRGRMTLRQGDFADSDTLVFRSMFYRPLYVGVGRLRTMSEVVLTPETVAIAAVGIFPEKDVAALVRKAAMNFLTHTAKDYAARVIWLSSVECRGKYREFMGYDGLFASCNFSLAAARFDWDDKNKRYWFPLTVMKSDPLAANSDEVLEIRGVYSGDAGDVGSLKIRYQNAENDPWKWKRSLEMYSPLNPRQVRNFTYRVDSVYTVGEDEVWVIHFQNKSGTFPRKTRICGEGFIHCLCDEARVVKVQTENLEDHYVAFPRTTVAAYPSATRHRVEVDYAVSNGVLYTSQITARVAWVDPGIESGRYYSFGQNRRRNPAANELREYTSVHFFDPVMLGDSLKRLVGKHAIPQNEYGFVLTAPFERRRWERIPMPGIDRPRLFRELGVNGRTLYEQAQARAFVLPVYNSSLGGPERLGAEEGIYRKRRLQYYKIGREIIYPTLYGIDYE